MFAQLHAILKTRVLVIDGAMVSCSGNGGPLERVFLLLSLRFCGDRERAFERCSNGAHALHCAMGVH